MCGRDKGIQPLGAGVGFQPSLQPSVSAMRIASARCTDWPSTVMRGSPSRTARDSLTLWRFFRNAIALVNCSAVSVLICER